MPPSIGLLGPHWARLITSNQSKIIFCFSSPPTGPEPATTTTTTSALHLLSQSPPITHDPTSSTLPFCQVLCQPGSPRTRCVTTFETTLLRQLPTKSPVVKTTKQVWLLFPSTDHQPMHSSVDKSQRQDYQFVQLIIWSMWLSKIFRTDNCQM